MFNFDSLLRLFSDWSYVSLFYSAALLLCILLIQELVFFSLIRTRRSKMETDSGSFPFFQLFRILRVFLRFQIFYVFLRIVKHSPGPLFPWNLVYGVVSNTILISGVLIPVYMVLNLAVAYLNSKTPDSAPEDIVLISSNRRLKFTLFFLAFSTVLWNILGLMPT
jgi:hypothetical protein